eukprot:2231035-Rhodomonas_salina.1
MEVIEHVHRVDDPGTAWKMQIGEYPSKRKGSRFFGKDSTKIVSTPLLMRKLKADKGSGRIFKTELKRWRK